MTAGFGAFGKMPSVGDFFRLNSPAGFVSVWDDWIQRTMLLTQTALGGEWDSRYMSAPIWRFSLSAGLAGSDRIMGVLMPSVDRVGRRFPLTLMAALPAAGPAARDHFRADAVFERLEDLALDALEDDMTRDGLERRLAEIDPPRSCDQATLRRNGHSVTLTRKRDQNGLLPDLSAGLLQDHCRTPSLWTAVTDEEQRLLVCDGMPEGPHMQALFDLDAPAWQEAATA